MNKPEQRDLDLTPFIGSEFDMVASNIEFNKRVEGIILPYDEIVQLVGVDSFDHWACFLVRSETERDQLTNNRVKQFCKPRTNKPQVLDDYSKVLVDGLVWRASYMQRYSLHPTEFNAKSRDLNVKNWDYEKFPLIYLSFIGVEKGSGLEDWAKRNDVPVIDLGGD